MGNINQKDVQYREIALFEIKSDTPINSKNYHSPGFIYIMDVMETMMKLENVTSNNFGISGSKEHFAAFWGGLIDSYINKDIELNLLDYSNSSE